MIKLSSGPGTNMAHVNPSSHPTHFLAGAAFDRFTACSKREFSSSTFTKQTMAKLVCNFVCKSRKHLLLSLK